MITRTITICTFVILSVLLVFCFTSIPDNHDAGQHAPGTAMKKAADAQSAVDGAAAAEAGEAVSQTRVKRQFRKPPAMNIPPTFFMVVVPIMILLLIYIVGIILNDISREDQEAVDEIFGTLN